MDQRERQSPTRTVGVTDLSGDQRNDVVAIEEPLTIRIATLAGSTADVAVTMRTPGNDDELAIGFLLAEAVITGRRDVLDVAPCAMGADEDATGNAIQVTLADDLLPDLARLDRHGLVTSACGVCGRRTIEALTATGVAPVAHDVEVPRPVIGGLPELLRAAQPIFVATGGTHAAAAVTTDGAVLELREDVGRHNAMDKLVGAAVLDGRSLANALLVLSGRASYELLMKAAVARMEVVVAMGAASSLAIDVAEQFGMTLVTFAASNPNVHTHPDRITAG